MFVFSIVLLLFVAIGLVGMGNRYHHKHHINSKSVNEPKYSLSIGIYDSIGSSTRIHINDMDYSFWL